MVRAKAYHRLPDSPKASSRATEPVLTEAEKELLHLLKSRGIPSICESISKEINYVWAVASGFRTLSNVGHFYFACASQTFGYNPALDFFASGGMQLAVFALQKFVHNENVLLPVLDCIHIYTKLHVEGGMDFLAVSEAHEILMKCVRFHDNKHNVISATCQALGSLVLNDLVKESVSSPELVIELLGLLKRYCKSLIVCRSTMVPLAFLVTDAKITATFVDHNGIALVMSAMKLFVQDSELVWHSIGILNALHADTVDIRLIYAIFGFTGIPRIVEALANHLDTEEIAVEGFQLLSRLATVPDAYRLVNQCKVLDLAYVALFAYSGPQHRHTRVEIKRTLHAFQKCTILDRHELSSREQASRKDLALYALFMLVLILSSALSLYGTSSSALVQGLQRSILETRWASRVGDRRSQKTLKDIARVDDVWEFLQGPLHEALFPVTWYNGDLFKNDVDIQLGVVDRANILLGGLQLRALRVQNSTCAERWRCYPPYSGSVELKRVIRRQDLVERWSAGSESDAAWNEFSGKLAPYPGSGYKYFIPRLSVTDPSPKCDPMCHLKRLQAVNWIDASTRAVFAEFNVFNAADGVHGVIKILFEFAPTGGILVSTQFTPVYVEQYHGLCLLSIRFYVELALLVGIIWYAKKQVDKILRYHLYYFVVPSHLVDAMILILWSVVIVFRLLGTTTLSHDLLVSLGANNSYIGLERAAYMVRQERDTTAWCALLMWWRLVRFAKCIRPLEQTLEKFERAEDLIESFLVFLAVYVLAFAQIGVLLFPSQIKSFRSFWPSVASTSKHLIKSRQHENGITPSFQLVFDLCAAFVTLNIVVVILRERFESRCAQTASPDVPDGLSLVQLAKRQLESSGMKAESITVSQKLGQAAARGIERMQHAAKDLFAINDGPVELTELKRVWGLEGSELSEDPNASAPDKWESLIVIAETEDRALDERLSFIGMRLQGALQSLDRVDQLRRKHQELLQSQRTIRTPAEALQVKRSFE